jgi:hypothetical protein
MTRVYVDDTAAREIANLRESLIAIAQWKCDSCGCRFAKKARTAFELDGVTHCSTCVENQILRHRLTKALQRNAAFAVVLALQKWRDDTHAEIYRGMHGHRAIDVEPSIDFLRELLGRQSAILALMQRPTGTKPPLRKKASKKAKR